MSLSVGLWAYEEAEGVVGEGGGGGGDGMTLLIYRKNN
jgi:hypothetical protein